MKSLFTILFFIISMSANAQIYKCVVNGKTEFSDAPCSDNAEVVDVKEATQKTGTQFSTDSMKDMGSAMGKERRTKELDRSIDRQQKKIDKIINDYNKKRERLNAKMADHKKKGFNKNWNTQSYKREQYYDKKRRIQNEIDEAYRRYKSDKELAYRKLSQLKKKRRELR